MNTPGPHSKSEIRDSLRALRTEGLTFWYDIAPEQFASAIGSAWSPADNVRHLAKATAPVALALRLPRIALRAMFGVATVASRTFDELRQTYLGVLSKGATAGRFAPSPTRPPADLGAWQQHLVGRCAASIDRVERGLGPWSEADLDRYRLPHPLLGRLTVREMALFTLYHYEHHKANVVRRMAASGGLPN
jgi:DinB superfamily